MVRGVLRVVVVVMASAALPPAADGATTTEVWYRVSARVRSFRADADLEAGGRLLFESKRSATGGRRLELARVLEDPWKFYWVDPLGPAGEEAKLAAVVTLAEGSWKELEAARARIAELGRSVHAAWSARGTSTRDLDGTFAFVVIGPARGRFLLDVDANGRMSSVENRMTDRWLAGPFDDYVGSWGPGAFQNHRRPTGYWFWNDGEDEPFDYEPHTYHALATALDLLALPLPAEGETAVRWPDVGRRALAVLERLAPRVPAGMAPRGLSAIAVETEDLPEGRRRLTIEGELAGGGEGGLTLDRRTLLSPSGLATDDQVSVRLEPTGRARGVVEIEVGYRDIVPFHE